MNHQLTHKEVCHPKSVSSISLITDRITSPSNLGGIVRASDAFGVNHLYFSGEQINLQSHRFKKSSRNTLREVNYTINQDAQMTVQALKIRGYFIIGLEITTQSKPLSSLQLPKNQQIVLVAGSEQHGISQEILAMVDTTVHIDMLGQNSSMNVTSAISIALYAITQQLQHDQ